VEEQSSSAAVEKQSKGGERVSPFALLCRTFTTELLCRVYTTEQSNFMGSRRRDKSRWTRLSRVAVRRG